MGTLRHLLALCAGLALAGGAAAAWHYWHIDGLIAVLVAGSGCGIAYDAAHRLMRE